MKRTTSLLAVFIAATAFAAAPLPAKELASPARITMGDWKAMQLNTAFSSGMVKARFDAPVVATFDAEAKKLLVKIYGSRSTVEGAKESVEDLRAVIGDLFRGELDDSNLTIIYFTGGAASASPKEIVRREAGKFVSP